MTSTTINNANLIKILVQVSRDMLLSVLNVGIWNYVTYQVWFASNSTEIGANKHTIYKRISTVSAYYLHTVTISSFLKLLLFIYIDRMRTINSTYTIARFERYPVANVWTNFVLRNIHSDPESTCYCA